MMAEPAWRKFSHEELDKLYKNGNWGGRIPASEILDVFIKILTEESELARSSVDCELNIAYGPTENEKLDIYGAKSVPTDAPVFVYIHGGYWQIEQCRRQQNATAVRPLVAAGALVVVIGYELAPKVKVPEIMRQVRSAVAHVLRLAKERKCRGVYVAGHSAGGHLTACVMATEWKEFPDVDPTLLKGYTPISGIFDVRPLVPTSINTLVGLTEEEAWENSPENHVDTIITNCRNAKVNVTVGEKESPELIRQSKSFHKALTDRGLEATYVEVPNVDHFNIVEKLRTADYSLTRELISMMEL